MQYPHQNLDLVWYRLYHQYFDIRLRYRAIPTPDTKERLHEGVKGDSINIYLEFVLSDFLQIIVIAMIGRVNNNVYSSLFTDVVSSLKVF